MVARWGASPVLLAAVAVVACDAQRALTIESNGAAGARTFLAIAGADGKWQSLHEVTEGVVPPAFEVRTDALLFSFTISPSDFTEAGDATTLTPERLLEAEVRLEDQPRAEGGACDRCLAAVGAGPQPVHDGDSCPLAASIPVSAWTWDGAVYVPALLTGLPPTDPSIRRAASLRARVRVDWPGACACPAPVLDSAPRSPITFELLAPSWVTAPYEVLALHPTTDAVAGFSALEQIVVDAAGTRYVRTDGLSGTVLGAVHLSVTASVARFFVVSLTGDAAAAPRYHVARGEPSLPIEPAPIAGLDGFVPRSVRRYDAMPEHPILIAGAYEGGAAVALCTDALSCRIQPITTCEGARVLLDAGMTGSGLVAGFVGSRRLAYASAETGRGGCVELASELAEPSGFPGYGVVNLQRIGAAGDRIFLCARMRSNDFRRFEDGGTSVFSALAPTSDRLQAFTQVFHLPGDGDYCDDLLEIDADRIGIAVRRAQFYEIDRDATITRTTEWSQISEDVFRVRAASPRSLAVTFGRSSITHTVYLGTGLGRAPLGGRAVSLHGGPYPNDPWFVYTDLAAHGGWIVAVPNKGDRALQRVVYDDTSAAIEDVSVASLYPTGGWLDVMVNAEFDSADGSLIVAGTLRTTVSGRPNRPWWRRVDLERGRVIADLLRTTAESDRDANIIAEIIPGVHVYTDDEGQLFSVRGDVSRLVTVVYDDPRTEAVEERPSSLGLDDPLDLVPDYGIDAIFAEGGVGWASGTLGFLSRIVPLPEDDPSDDHVRVEMVTVNGELPDPAIRLRAGAALCPDALAVGASGTKLVTPSAITPLDPPAAFEAARPDLELEPEILLRAGSDLVTVTTDRWILVNGQIVGRAPFAVFAAETDGRVLVLSGFPNRLALARFE